MSLKEILKEKLPAPCFEQLRQWYRELHYAYMHIVPKEWYLKRVFQRRMGYPLNLDNPRTFNEKLQWLKLHDHNPLYTTMVDKYAAKEYVAGIIGDEYIIPTLGVWDHFDDIDFDQLPNQFVLKCTHDSGSIAICTDKKTFDKQAARKKLEKGLKYNFYYSSFEWPYKNVKPRIIAEKYMVDESREQLKDYKIFNFNGEPQIIDVDYDRFKRHKINLYNTDWEYIDAIMEYPNDPDYHIDRPKVLEKMLEFSRKLSKSIAFIRTDFYCIDTKIYFGEITFYPGAGFEKFTPKTFDIELGNVLKIPGGGYLLRQNEFVIYLRPARKLEIEPVSSVNMLTDYKLMCFSGKVRCSFTCTGRQSPRGLHVTFYNRKWKKLPFERHYPAEPIATKKPLQYEKMIELAEKLTQSMSFARIDFYIINEKIYFGEITFYPGSGFEEFTPVEWDERIGEWIKL